MLMKLYLKFLISRVRKSFHQLSGRLTEVFVSSSRLHCAIPRRPRTRKEKRRRTPSLRRIDARRRESCRRVCLCEQEKKVPNNAKKCQTEMKISPV